MMLLLKGFYLKPAALMLLAFSSLILGCGNQNNLSATNVPNNTKSALDAYALSGGKITRFIPEPGLPNSPADKAMLMACQQIPITSNTAQSASAVINTGQFGNFPLNVLIVGHCVLMLPGDLATMGIEFSSTKHSFVLYPRSLQSITLTHGSKIAYVGKKQVYLQEPVIATKSNDLVMTLSDMKAVFHERDMQRHQPSFIRDTQIIYDIRDYHR